MLAFFALVAIPLIVFGREKISLIPETKDLGNSQTTLALEAHRNINPTGSTGSAEIAIVDDVALESNMAGGEFFMDLGKSGTGQISVYVVRRGDTLSEISKMHAVSTNTIIWANNLRGTTIKEGQELVILPISGVRHTVKSGETLSSVAKKYKAELEDVLSYNNINSDAKIKSGDVIIIPNGIMSTTSLASSSVSGSYQNAPLYEGYYLRPIVGGRKSQGFHGRGAVDLAAPVGTAIRASASGKVLISRSGGYNGGYGTYVVISHGNGTQTLYAHMKANHVSVGQNVAQGQTIGTIGMTGRTTGPHLHFEVRGAKNPF